MGEDQCITLTVVTNVMWSLLKPERLLFEGSGRKGGIIMTQKDSKPLDLKSFDKGLMQVLRSEDYLMNI